MDAFFDKAKDLLAERSHESGKTSREDQIQAEEQHRRAGDVYANEERRGEEAGYGRRQAGGHGSGSYGERREEGYGRHEGSYGERRGEEGYGRQEGGHNRHEESSYSERRYEEPPRRDERTGSSGYSGRGDTHPATYGSDTTRDTRGYSRPGGSDYGDRRQHGERESYYNGSVDAEAQRVAEQHAGSHESSLFSSALGLLKGRESSMRHDDVDEGEYVKNHQKLYGQGHSGQQNSQSLGQAAAIQALKMFTSGGKEKQQGGQSAFIGMAMAEAAKLFDSQSAKGNVAPQESKQDVVGQAAQVALKLFMKSKIDSGAGGSGSGDLLGLASKFLF
ncbi:hypothetical protein FN846DRAFT_784841 [Sphaerosporella brunnea]|uniref:DUF7721 domain-containing protein n=1 Tax=Sphaerosporella brunnea TaxID=1250544 RepID=A0A5J5EIT3_9PEZI|nr:hypothetical protein FN846DRAFT_784841 [Sphaerosporella brunnea]